MNTTGKTNLPGPADGMGLKDHPHGFKVAWRTCWRAVHEPEEAWSIKSRHQVTASSPARITLDHNGCGVNEAHSPARITKNAARMRRIATQVQLRSNSGLTQTNTSNGL